MSLFSRILHLFPILNNSDIARVLKQIEDLKQYVKPAEGDSHEILNLKQQFRERIAEEQIGHIDRIMNTESFMPKDKLRDLQEVVSELKNMQLRLGLGKGPEEHGYSGDYTSDEVYRDQSRRSSSRGSTSPPK